MMIIIIIIIIIIMIGGTDGPGHQADRKDGGGQIPWCKEPAAGAQNDAAEFFDNVGDRIDDGAGCPWNRLDMCTNIMFRGQERQL
jgi:hypothetical protein